MTAWAVVMIGLYPKKLEPLQNDGVIPTTQEVVQSLITKI